MDITLVQNPEHDIDRDQRRENQKRLAANEILKGLRRSRQIPCDVARQANFGAASSIASTASPSDTPGPRLNEGSPLETGPGE